MVRHVNDADPATMSRPNDSASPSRRKQRPVWPAFVLMVLAGGAVLWHILACTESPMAFSPDGKNVAFVVMEPYGGDHAVNTGPHAYRLMVLSDRKAVRVIEETADAMLTAPAYSPDGKRMAYLRIPLLTPAQQRSRSEAEKQRKDATDKFLGEAIDVHPAGAPAVPPLEVEDCALPPAEGIEDVFRTIMGTPPLPAQLVLRDAQTDAVVQTLPIELHGITIENESFFKVYATIRPQFSPDGRWIYLCDGITAFAIDPQAKRQRIFAVPAMAAALSPDGSQLAVLQPKGVGFVRTDGQVALYCRWTDEKPPSLSGLAWLDNRTLGIVSAKDDEPQLRFLRTDGTWLGAKPVALPKAGDDKANTGELAIASDGKHMAVAYGYAVHFLDGEGKVLATWKSPDGQKDEPGPGGWLAQPTFTPDGKSVAFKVVAKEGEAKSDFRTKAIVFFSPEGKEQSRVELPKVKAGVIRAVEQ